MDRRIESLSRQVRALRILVLALLAVVSVIALTSFEQSNPDGNTATQRVERFDELTVGRLNIAGPDGINRIILSHTMPQAPFQGEMLDRTVPPGMAGIIYCAPNGDEVGGIGVSGTEQGGHALITLDYRNTPLEAVGLATHFGPDGQTAGLAVMDSPTGTVDIKKIKALDEAEVKRLQGMMVTRISLGVEGHDAALSISDRNGKPRIVIGVDDSDHPEIRVLDEQGTVVARLPSD